jgi:hypothetical protein
LDLEIYPTEDGQIKIREVNMTEEWFNPEDRTPVRGVWRYYGDGIVWSYELNEETNQRLNYRKI